LLLKNELLYQIKILTMSEEYDIEKVKQKGIEWIEKMLEDEITYTKLGSVSYLLYGKRPSEQSVNIKIGRFGEFISKELIKINGKLNLLSCGVQKINCKKKDVDLIFKNEEKKIMYYRELKGNIELDTEKMTATIEKCEEIKSSLEAKYPDFVVDFGILNWSVYDRNMSIAGITNIKKFENSGVKINHMKDFLNIIDVVWTEDDYYLYFREIGKKISSKFE
jgi:hypothetical protein